MIHIPFPEIYRISMSNQIPDKLRKSRNWLLWRCNIDINDEISYIPVNPRTGEDSNILSPIIQTTYEDAFETYFRHSLVIQGMGFVFINTPYMGVHFYDCRNKLTGQVDEQVKVIINELDNYTEIGVDGTSLTTILKGKTIPEDILNICNIKICKALGFLPISGKLLDGMPSTIKDIKDIGKILAEHVPSTESDPDQIDPDLEQLKQLWNIIKTSPGLNQSHIFQLAKDQLCIRSKGKLLKLLKKGADTYWTLTRSNDCNMVNYKALEEPCL